MLLDAEICSPVDLKMLKPPKNVRMIDPPRCAVCRYLIWRKEDQSAGRGGGWGCARTEDGSLPPCPGDPDHTLKVCDGFRR